MPVSVRAIRSARTSPSSGERLSVRSDSRTSPSCSIQSRIRFWTSARTSGELKVTCSSWFAILRAIASSRSPTASAALESNGNCPEVKPCPIPSRRIRRYAWYSSASGIDRLVLDDVLAATLRLFDGLAGFFLPHVVEFFKRRLVDQIDRERALHALRAAQLRRRDPKPLRRALHARHLRHPVERQPLGCRVRRRLRAWIVDLALGLLHVVGRLALFDVQLAARFGRRHDPVLHHHHDAIDS